MKRVEETRRLRWVAALSVILWIVATVPVTAQFRGRPEPKSSDEPTMFYEDYEPRSTLVVPETILTRSKFPFIDAHAHLRGTSSESVDQVIADMDAMNMGVAINLSGRSGDAFVSIQEGTAGRYPGRILNFANISFNDIDDPDWGERTAAGLERDVKAGAVGLKIYKNLGMFVRDQSGARVATDDPRIEPVWDKAGELGIPVLIHVGEPSAFWSPHDETNERWLELKQRPERKRAEPEFATFEQTMAEQHNMFRKHPNTNFINAHLGWLGNDLEQLGQLLDEIPNMYTEIGAVLAELGRQPRAARDFLIKYQDRVLFGKDSWNPSEYHVYFRVLETNDEYFDYYRKRHAHWKMYGLGLPDDVLKKIYYGNAIAIIPGIDRSLFE